MPKNNVFFSLILILLAITILHPAQASALDVKKQVLDNGLTVLHVQRDNLPMVVATLIVRGGQKDEPERKAGLANFTASMLSEGTGTRSSIEISRELEFIGASLSASADMDYASIKLSVLKQYHTDGFDIFFDVLLNPVFDENETERKKARYIASIQRQLDDPDYVAEQAFEREVFGTHPYAHPRTGTPESLESFTREDIVSFYKERYAPEGAVLAFVGDISAEEVNGLVEKYLVDWKGSVQKDKKRPDPPGPERHTVTINREVTQANIYLGHLGVSRNDPDYYALSIMNYILGGGGFTSRLMSRVRDEMGLAYSIYSRFDSRYEAGSFYVNVQTKNVSANTVITEILSQMRRIAAEPVSEQELADAKSYYIGSFPRRLETMSRIADFYCAVEFYGLGLDYPEKYRGYIGAVTSEDVQRVARKYLLPDNYVLVVVGNLKEADLRDEFAEK